MSTSQTFGKLWNASSSSRNEGTTSHISILFFISTSRLFCREGEEGVGDVFQRQDRNVQHVKVFVKLQCRTVSCSDVSHKVADAIVSNPVSQSDIP